MNKDEFKKKAIDFVQNPKYYNPPYNKKTWGNNWHSICSYRGKLKPAIAHFLIKEFTEPNDRVLDPMSGVGTIPFEACLQGRKAFGNDLSKMAYIVSNSKINICKKNDVLKVIDELELYIENGLNDCKKINKLVKKYEDFGFNKTLKEYFDKKTFKEILLGREFFIYKENLKPADCIVFSSFMHVLHGNRPYALSRTSHPLTPYAPKGEYIYKSVIECIKNKVEILYKSSNKEKENIYTEYDLKNYVSGCMNLGNVLNISEFYNNIDIIITSPPFVSSLRFYTQNWMRLWLSGWEIDDFKQAEIDFLESKQKKDLSIYKNIFEEFYKVLKPKGRIILHLGKTDKFDMAKEISIYCEDLFEIIYIGEENVSKVQKHGIKDKGSTNVHQFMFLEKK